MRHFFSHTEGLGVTLSTPLGNVNFNNGIAVLDDEIPEQQVLIEHINQYVLSDPMLRIVRCEEQEQAEEMVQGVRRGPLTAQDIVAPTLDGPGLPTHLRNPEGAGGSITGGLSSMDLSKMMGQ